MGRFRGEAGRLGPWYALAVAPHGMLCSRRRAAPNGIGCGGRLRFMVCSGAAGASWYAVARWRLMVCVFGRTEGHGVCAPGVMGGFAVFCAISLHSLLRRQRVR